ncbi:MAG: Fe-S cluster assembly protein SufD [Halobacteriovoraceae bacterium]|nr:Fe-S cluster assembly protein SufD [Halobacteriovoraceae bacterium]|tara:strand:+ start:53920 stop:55131 length:1212 start_codon:yes stop_codon:yes gene_type:complete
MSITEQVEKDFSTLESSKENLGLFLQKGLPTKKNELWKYTNLERFWQEFDLSKQQKADLNAIEKDENFNHIFFVNGAFLPAQSDLEVQSGATELTSLKHELKELLANESVFHLVESQTQNQYLLTLEGVQEKPVLIHNFYTSEHAKHSSAHLHVLAKANSETTIIESHTSEDTAESFINNAVSFLVENNARLSFIKTQELGEQSVQVQNTRALVKRDGQFESFTVDAGAKLSRNNISIRLDGEGANCAAHGLYVLGDTQQSDTNSFIHHNRPHTESSQLYKGIMNDKSHGIFTGLIRVEKDAQLINSDQLNKNLLLSKGAHAHSRPQLEIYADDVKCAHGSTTGQMSDEELFYFESRGVPRERAQKLLAQAFAYDVVLKIKNKTAREYAQQVLKKNFKNLKVE